MNAIVLLYKGMEVTSYVLEKIVEQLLHLGVAPEDVSSYVLNEEDIAKLVAKHVIPKQQESSPEYALEQAVIYITTKFSDVIDDNMIFSISLSAACKSYPLDSALLKAVELIGKNKIPTHLCKKYNLTTSKINVIRHVYKYHSNV